MTKLIGRFLIAAFLLHPALALASDARCPGPNESWVNAPHTRNGGYCRTHANGTKNDNYSTRGNRNPHTGEYGTKPRDGERR